MRKSLLSFVLVFLFFGCSSNYYTFDINDVGLKKNYTFDSCTNSSYISNFNNEKYGNLFIEYINLDSSCNWNGFQRGYFEYLFKTTIKLDSIKLVEVVDFKNFELLTYLVDNKYYFNLIYNFTVNEDIFIIDYEGKYFDEKIKKLIPSYVNDYLNKPRFVSQYNNSLVKMNFINAYFSKDNEVEINNN